MATIRNGSERGAGFALEPEKAVTASRLAMRAGAEEPWLRLDLKGLSRFRWVRLKYSTSYYDDPVRPLIRFATSGRKYTQAMNGPVAGSAEWIGRIPQGTTGISISPVRETGPFQFRLESIESVPRAFLVKRGIRYDKWSLMQSIGAKVINADEERWDTLRFAATATALEDYDAWYRRNYRPLDLDGIDRPRSDWSKAPAVHLLVALRGAPARILATIASLKAQAFQRWTLTAIAAAGSGDELEPIIRKEMAADRRIGFANGERSFAAISRGWDPSDFAGVVDAGDKLPVHALAAIVEALARRPNVRVIYGDEDAEAPGGTLHSPILKPDWSPVFYERSRYLGRLTLVRADDLAGSATGRVEDFIGDETAVMDRALAAAGGAAIHHLRRIVYRRSAPVTRIAAPAVSVAAAVPPAPAEEPAVSIIIPTRDRADLLAQCLLGIHQHTRYRNYEIVLVDNGTKAEDAKVLLDRCRDKQNHTVIERPGPFNFSSLSNDGAAQASGDILVFLNNDIIVFAEDWLRNLVHWASRPDVGAAGAKLLFPDRSIEHAGVVIGHGGLAGHIHHREPDSAEGYMRQLMSPREVSATTGACLAIGKEKFKSVGGFDAKNLPVDLNDIDLCLKLRERGWRIVWTPDAIMYHLQSASRGFPVRPSRTYLKERTYFRNRWMHVIRDDPFFHPALSLFSHKLALA